MALLKTLLYNLLELIEGMWNGDKEIFFSLLSNLDPKSYPNS